ncbi:ATP-grasp ribosomal peptide maturase [Streptomyces inusitatus]|uniref:ATP-grasp ribosomal peptide maturase n=1 Tax=Streptomyces inusitatus TaxID=68221 RepID=A0A918V302_9ACTN|nr:ATP-grasp ribosomal peptide maturase [Streptomyces inusitatus]GGZ56724.1 ATP-grasp ribosomal peptide maturase [Streptomyces inusitatus]
MTFRASQGTRGGLPPRVLVVTHALDPTADFVLRELNERRVPFWRTDLADFPTRTTLRTELGADGRWTGSLHDSVRGIDLSELRAVWWRKPTVHELPGSMSGPERRFAVGQAKRAITVLGALPGVLWVNRPQVNVDCTKPVHLAAAVASGLQVPETLITNDPAAVPPFARRCDGRIVTKVLGGIVHTEGGTRGQLYTRRVPEEQWREPRIALTAHLFQREITDRAYEVRVAVVAGRLFAAAIHAPAGHTGPDWRHDSDAFTHTVIDLPASIADAVREMMRRLGLVFAALDFIVDGQGAHYLVDVNAGGQWAWIEPTREPITHAIADLLQKGSTRR